MSEDYAIEQTKVATAGVFRCCVASVGREHEGKRVKLGDKSECEYCHEKFTLVGHTGGFPPRTFPLWKPDWQIEQDNATTRGT